MDATETKTRTDYEWLRSARNEQRPLERLVAHYELERDLARQLASSNREQRKSLYGAVYDRLFTELPDHPQWTIKRERRVWQANDQRDAMRDLINAETDFVELGCGDALTCIAIAPLVKSSVGIDVTERLVEGDKPANFRLVLSDGVHLPLPDASADLVLSNQLIEHLHLDDAHDQLREVHRILKPGGRYVCMTPNRLMGPNDISVFFGHEPRGFHMQEFDHRALAETMRAAGFTDLRARGILKGRRYDVPVATVGAIETMLEAVPRAGRFWLFRRLGFLYRLSGVTVVGRK